MEKIFTKLYRERPDLFDIQYTTQDKSKFKFLLDLIVPSKIIDGGCGLSTFIPTLMGETTQYLGIDILPDLINIQNSNIRNNCEYLCKDITTDTLPYADIIILSDVIQFFNNHTIKKLFYNIKRNGIQRVLLTSNNNSTNFTESVNGFGRQVNILTGPFGIKSDMSIHLSNKTYLNLIYEW